MRSLSLLSSLRSSWGAKLKVRGSRLWTSNFESYEFCKFMSCTSQQSSVSSPVSHTLIDFLSLFPVGHIVSTPYLSHHCNVYNFNATTGPTQARNEPIQIHITFALKRQGTRSSKSTNATITIIPHSPHSNRNDTTDNNGNCRLEKIIMAQTALWRQLHRF